MKLPDPLSAPALAAVMLLAGCRREDASVDRSRIMPMIGAVMESATEEVRRLAEKGVELNERDPADQATPIIEAAQTDQWPSVEVLMDHGAEIWAHDQFGITASEMAASSRILRGSKEDQARVRVIGKLKGRGFPWPPPSSDEILALDKAGRWPPPGVKR